MISLINLSNLLWDKPILKNINWETQFCQNWAILGPNGAGKSTLVKVVLGQLPYRGTIKRHKRLKNMDKISHVSFEQQKIIVAREERKDKFEEYSGKDENFMTGSEAIDPFNQHPDKLTDIANQLGINDLLLRPLRFFSNGETRKCLIANALLAEPELLILDEPFDGLDKDARQWLASIISTLINDGLTIWLISHRFDELVPEISNVLCLKEGEIFAQGSRSDILTEEQMKHLYAHQAVISQKTSPISQTNKKPQKDESLDAKIIEETNIINMQNVNVKYGEKIILHDFNWKVRKGENWKILGPNGAGKSTLLSLISGDNLQAYSNKIILFGKQRGTGESIWDIKKHIGLVSPELQVRYRESISALKVVLSGLYDTIGYYQPASKEEQEMAEKWLDFLDITELMQQDFTRLSYGQQRLVLISRAMVKSPELLILDEPCQGLDQFNRTLVLNIVDQIALNTKTQILYVTHADADKLICLDRELCFEADCEGGYHPVFYDVTG